MNQPEAFVYRWTNRKNDMIYIGKHRGTIDDGYISSGKQFLLFYNADPHHFYRDILFYGTDHECLLREAAEIKTAVQTMGWGMLYNRTHWHILREHSIRCLHCGSVCDPNNPIWLEQFNQQHFSNCRYNL